MGPVEPTEAEAVEPTEPVKPTGAEAVEPTEPVKPTGAEAVEPTEPVKPTGAAEPGSVPIRNFHILEHPVCLADRTYCKTYFPPPTKLFILFDPCVPYINILIK